MTYLSPGDLLDRFRIIKRLDSGGMGHVYLALDTERFVNVALKTIHQDHDQYDRLRKRFALEADAYRRLSHPNVVGMVAAGTAGTIDYIALEHIRGTSLADLLSERGVLPLDLAESILQDLVYALSAAHQADIIHRDIKPKNIMITANNVTKLIDFGVAKEFLDSELLSDIESSTEEDDSSSHSLRGISSGGSSTGSGAVVGTLAYCSPEQLQCLHVDARSDIYSLGLVLYELFTGLRPIAGSTAADILLNQSKLDTRIIPPSQIEPRLHPALESMILKMIRYDRDERFQSSIELIEQIHGLDLHHRASAGDSHLAKTKSLATLELADTYYWKAQSHFDHDRPKEALREFVKLSHTCHSIAEPVRKAMMNQIDGLFRSHRPLVPAFDDDFPPETPYRSLSYGTYIEILGSLITLYRRIGRPRSAVLALITLERRLRDLRDLHHAPLITAFSAVAERVLGFDDVRKTRDSLESLREGGVVEDMALERALDNIDIEPERALERLELLADRAILLLALHEDGKALECAHDVLQMDDKHADAINVAVTVLAERGIVFRDPSPEVFWLDFYEVMGLVDSAGVELKKRLHGDVSDLGVYDRLITLYRRFERSEELWHMYVHMAGLFLEANHPERCRELIVQALSISPPSKEAVAMVKSLKNVHKVFSLQELATLGTERPFLTNHASAGRTGHEREQPEAESP